MASKSGEETAGPSRQCPRGNQNQTDAAAASTSYCHTSPLTADTPDDQYLHHTVVPALVRGMSELDKARPDDPLGFLAAFLLKYRKEHVDKDKRETEN